MILAVLNGKGGVGKTTISIGIAHALVLRAGGHVLLVDADPQATATRWVEKRQESRVLPFSTMQMAHSRFTSEIQPHVSGQDFLVVDCPPRLDDITRSVMWSADFVLIPVTPSYYDIWATEATIEMLREVRKLHFGAPKAALVLNRARPGTTIEGEVFEALKAFQQDVSLLQTRLHERTAHQLATRTGQTVIELQPSSAAAQELESVVAETVALAYAED